MKLHASVVAKLLYYFHNYGGHERDTKLEAIIKELDLTPYERKTGDQEIVLVTTEDYMKSLNNPGGG